MTAPAYDPGLLRALAVSETGFVFDPRTGHSYTVNATGLEALRGLKEGLPLDRVAARLREEFDAEEAAVEDDLEAFLAVLREHGLAGRGAGGGGEEGAP